MPYELGALISRHTSHHFNDGTTWCLTGAGKNAPGVSSPVSSNSHSIAGATAFRHVSNTSTNHGLSKLWYEASVTTFNVLTFLAVFHPLANGETIVLGPGGACGFIQEERLLGGITSGMAFHCQKSTKKTYK